jgi:hypothetical protein
MNPETTTREESSNVVVPIRIILLVRLVLGKISKEMRKVGLFAFCAAVLGTAHSGQPAKRSRSSTESCVRPASSMVTSRIFVRLKMDGAASRASGVRVE